MEELDTKTFSMMQTERPFTSYKKTTLGKVFVTVLNPFTQMPEGLMLEGNFGTESEIVDTWSEKEDIFFRRMNMAHLKSGAVIKFVREEKPEEKRIEQYSDAELKELLSLRYLAFSNVLSEVNTEVVLQRLLAIAKQADKSIKYISAIESRLSDVQANL